MAFDTEQSTLQSGIVLLTVSGVMTMGNQLQSFELLVEGLTRAAQNKIVIDMSNVTYIDSSAIGVLVGCLRVIKSSGGQLRLAGATNRVLSTLKIVGLEDVLPSCPTREEAIAEISLSH